MTSTDFSGRRSERGDAIPFGSYLPFRTAEGLRKARPGRRTADILTFEHAVTFYCLLWVTELRKYLMKSRFAERRHLNVYRAA